MEQPPRSNAIVEVNVIVPVHNAEATIQEAIQSVLDQQRPAFSNGDEEDDNDDQCRCTNDSLVAAERREERRTIVIYICCYDDASTDESWSILTAMMQKQQQKTSCQERRPLFETHILLERGTPPARGAGYARNRAVAMRSNVSSNSAGTAGVSSFSTASTTPEQLLCWLDSDDLMHPTRIYEQARHLLTLPENALLGTYMERIPADATWHYTHWVNNMSEERIMLERFRELTVIQPTWMMRRTHFDALGGYLEAPALAGVSEGRDGIDDDTNDGSSQNWYDDWYRQQSRTRLILTPPHVETIDTLRVAEDLRFFHEHLAAGGTLHLLRRTLVTYRHRGAASQSSQTPRKLLLQLRALALERSVLSSWDRFVVWGAGRDGKDFIRSLSPGCRDMIYCLVDVDDAKIARGHYETREWKIPIVHFSALAPNSLLYEDWKTSSSSSSRSCHALGAFSNIDKGRGAASKSAEPEVPGPSTKKARKNHQKEDPGMKTLNSQLLQSLPVVVCVAMYRTNGALEHNVALIKRTEGVNLYHLI
jgi:glycosyltransferase involved in cell wall biosynthesis